MDWLQSMPDWLKAVLWVAGYIAVMRWVLPAFGIPTCMSGACQIPQKQAKPTEVAQPHDQPHV